MPAKKSTKAKQRKMYMQWVTKLKKQIGKGVEQIKKIKFRFKNARTDSTLDNMAMNLKAMHQKKGDLKSELRELSQQHKKLTASEYVLKQFKKDHQKLEFSKAKAKRSKPEKIKSNSIDQKVENTSQEMETNVSKDES